jgi:hypothetical protein
VLAGPEPEEVTLPVDHDRQGKVRGRLAAFPSLLHPQRVNEDDRIHLVQRTRLPFSHALQHLVITKIVSLETAAPYASARCTEISPAVRPLADSDNTMQ